MSSSLRHQNNVTKIFPFWAPPNKISGYASAVGDVFKLFLQFSKMFKKKFFLKFMLQTAFPVI